MIDLSNYSCDKCAREFSRHCKCCLHTVDKVPTKFKHKENIFQKAIREAKEFNILVESFTTPKFRKLSPPPPPNAGHQPTTSVITQPPNVGSSVQPNKITSLPMSVKTKCTYITPCGWCTKWDKKCDEKPYKRGLRIKINPIDDTCGLKLERL